MESGFDAPNTKGASAGAGVGAAAGSDADFGAEAGAGAEAAPNTKGADEDGAATALVPNEIVPVEPKAGAAVAVAVAGAGVVDEEADGVDETAEVPNIKGLDCVVVVVVLVVVEEGLPKEMEGVDEVSGALEVEGGTPKVMGALCEVGAKEEEEDDEDVVEEEEAAAAV